MNTDYRAVIANAAMIALVALSACATTSIAPAPGAQMLPGTSDIAVSRVDGVEVTVQADAWKGDYAVSAAVQPVRVTINNNSSKPVRVRYDDFALVTPSGHRYSALPPFKVEGEILSPSLAAGFSVIMEPAFGHRRFYIAPYIARAYPGIPVYRGRYHFYDPFYYDFYYRNMIASVRPTIEMLSLALPEGVIAPDGQVWGFVYFEKVDPGVATVTFREQLVSLDDAGAVEFGEISIPFTVTTTR